MSKVLIVPVNYKSLLDLNQTEKAIKLVKDTFQQQLSAEIHLRRVTAPLFVLKGTGINDDLNGTERKVGFPIKDMNDSVAEVVNSLAKWKRMALADYCIPHGNGIYTDMNAIRPDEEFSNIHSLYVDQWDWERVIAQKDRNLDFLKYIVRKIYEAMKRTEYVVYENYNSIKPVSAPRYHLPSCRRIAYGVSPSSASRTRICGGQKIRRHFRYRNRRNIGQWRTA